MTCSRTAALSNSGEWDRRFMNFDNIGYAFIVMLRVITFDNWYPRQFITEFFSRNRIIALRYYLVEELGARGVVFTSVFFIFQIFTVSYLSLNLFTGVVGTNL